MAQFNPLAFSYGRTDPTIQGIGIGNFPAVPLTNVNLFVHGQYLTSSTTTEQFRTVGNWGPLLAPPGGLDSHWRMFRASGPTVLGEAPEPHQIGHIYCRQGPANNGFNIQQTRQGGSLWLRNRRGQPNANLEPGPITEANKLRSRQPTKAGVCELHGTNMV